MTDDEYDVLIQADLRDDFACAALKGLIPTNRFPKPEELVKQAYRIADLMLKEREK